MDCPICKTAMIVLELEEVEVDYCPQCVGIWLDAGELELLLDDAHKAKELLESFKAAKSDEKKRKCPICRKTMEKVLVGQHDSKQELIDRCPRQHGLWFDRGELQAVLTMGRFDDAGRIQRLLGDLFCPEAKNPQKLSQ
ncbi:MAG TPA: zf-TFIIB domain-containing protein [Anaerohalosphaeraceae bacterium]|nr:zf-TFIIB domain-containing protein [Phycisphaerae bacterium]HOK96166.1 zf-TFIIB domain-containing protein [Anaerohalosphaeraceae bacterium]HOL30442.1 zf-TFIIB domain-containing protein [Anaerohalosphaeraceae bacterium]HOM75812.1 zf-TFIIB domain-containing protein [Anaerohalosphaeraceae bacterium]HPC64089.1 zf-TFIIB domain-containing protein [Anaerohalosphaeraceae bacterium]